MRDSLCEALRAATEDTSINWIDDILLDAANRIEFLTTEVARIKACVQLHYDQRGDNRCWEDDLKLYHDVLGIVPDPMITAMPPDPDAEESCRRYRSQRQHPDAHGKYPMPGDMTIAQLTTAVERLQHTVMEKKEKTT